MKTALKYFQESYDNVSEDATITLPLKNLTRIMDGYAQYKVNELNKSDVIKSVCEIDKHKFEGKNNGLYLKCKICGMETM